MRTISIWTFRHIKIEPTNSGRFLFGLVCGEIDGRVIDYANGKRFEFAWEGNDECDPVFGSGWVRIKEKDTIHDYCSDSKETERKCI